MGGDPLCTISSESTSAMKQGRRGPISMKTQGRGMAIVGDEGRCTLFRGLSEWCTSHLGRTKTEAAFLIKRTPALPDCLMRTLIARFATDNLISVRAGSAMSSSAAFACELRPGAVSLDQRAKRAYQDEALLSHRKGRQQSGSWKAMAAIC